MARLALLALCLASASAASVVRCDVGTYYWGEYFGKAYCVKCPAGLTSSGCVNCAVDKTHARCSIPRTTTCARGKFSSAPNVCADCPIGRWSDCTDCGSCHACPAGFWQPKAGSFSCYKCRAGSYQPKVASAKCDNCATCPRGTYGTTQDVGAKSARACECKSCAKGKYAPAGYTKCFACPAGRFQPQTAHYTCYYCPSGQFQAATGAAKCTKCPAGFTTQVKQGASSSAQCVRPQALRCDAGRFMFFHAQSKSLYCLGCPAGKYGRTLADYQYGGHCFSCPTAQFQPKQAQTACAACPAGRIGSATRLGCVAAPETLPPTAAPAAPVDCALRWGAWSQCSRSCGANGAQQRTAAVARAARNGGRACPTQLAEERACSNGPCPVHCVTSAFSAWSACSRECGSAGISTRARTVVKEAASGGAVCPFLTEQRPCNRGTPCAEDCVVGTWGAWSQCAVSCGGATKRRTRHVLQAAVGLGQECPRLTQDEACNSAPCPVDCVQTEWTLWSRCSASCGAATQARTRGTIQEVRYGGGACPHKHEVRTCNTFACPVDCVHSDWTGEWAACSATCGGGVQISTRKVKTKAANGGKPCGKSMYRRCNLAPCPVDCVASAWSTLSACSAKCGGGSQSRSRTVVRAAAEGGVACGSLKEVSTCNPHKCAVDCVIAQWGEWSTCSLSCAGGWQLRTRTAVAPAFGGKICPALSETQRCAKQACPVDCVLGAWDDWTLCNVECGRGQTSRVRRIAAQPLHGGKACPEPGTTLSADGSAKGAYSQMKACSAGPCAASNGCPVSAWSLFTGCTKTCGGGSKKRTRAVLTANPTGACPALKQVVPCSNNPCPAACKLTPWTAWSACSLSCGGGKKWRTRAIRKAAVGGASCGAVQQVRTCAKQGCAVKCVAGAWGSWSACSKTCGQGHEARRRTVQTAAAFGGAACELVQRQPCHERECPVACVVSEWEAYGACSATCGPGTRPHRRTVVSEPRHGGFCPSLVSTLPCTLGDCPIHCTVTKFGEWEACTKSCGGGRLQRRRTVVTHAKAGGFVCPRLVDIKPCNLAPCPQACVVTAWGAWGPCDKSCGTGTRQRTRNIDMPEAHGGAGCPSLLMQGTCNVHECPVNCKTSEWSTWSPCSKTCGGGSRTRTRTVTDQPYFGGKNCPVDLTAHAQCEVAACPLDCKLAAWGAWSSCDKTCGNGVQFRIRAVDHMAIYGGRTCANTRATRNCEPQACPIDCGLSQWATWAKCTRTCGAGGSRSRTREVFVQPEFGGTNCPRTSETEVCDLVACPMDCDVASWGTWGDCSTTCGSGISTRTRTATTPKHGGKLCPALSEEKQCATFACPLDCTLSVWGEWADCSRTCGFGARTRERTVTRAASDGGVACATRFDTQECHLGGCPVNCKVSSFGNWGACSKSCGGGVQVRVRTAVAATASSTCPSTRDERQCKWGACPADCTMTTWGAWSECSTTCGVGSKVRARKVATAAVAGGKACGALSKSARCSKAECPVDCRVTMWGGWSQCTKSCGAGVQRRIREVRTEPRTTGKQCPALTGSRKCNTGTCPTDCVVEPWSAWDSCSRSCGTGFRTRKRTVTQPGFGGKLCPVALETRLCNESPCPRNCDVSPWGKFSECSVSCGHGFQIRHRHVVAASIGAGASCPSLTMTRGCNFRECPINCKVGPWSDLTPCSQACGGGISVRTRTVLAANAYGGRPCPHLSEQAQCNEDKCPVTGCALIARWGAWTSCSASCGTGQRTRERKPLGRKNASGGYSTAFVLEPGIESFHSLPACVALEERKTCSSVMCPIDCKTSAWSEWQPCSKSCGTGVTKRFRSEIVSAAFGGAKCTGKLTQLQECDEKPCPVDCLSGDWDAWSRCTATCGTGEQSRSRKVTRQAAYGGALCKISNERRFCNTFKCPIDCQVGGWSTWDTCTQQCGGGQQKRTRTASVLASHGGKACPPRVSYQVCNTKICRCAHIRCHFALHAATGRERIRVTHDADEFMGRKHKCGYNYQSQACECRCFDKLAKQAAGFFNVLPVAAADQIRTTAGNTYSTATWLRDEPRGIPGNVLTRNKWSKDRSNPKQSAAEVAAP